MNAPANETTDRLSEPELRAWRGMLRVHATVTQALDADLRAAHGLSLPSYEVLMFLADADGERMRMADLADRVLLSRSGLTRLVDRLVEMCLVQRRTCADDGRGAYAELTPAGRRALEAARRTHLAGVRRRFLARLSADDRRLLGEVWERMRGVAAIGEGGQGR